jgi:2,5-diketo-D-gluconate reductase A
VFEAYSPLERGRGVRDPTIVELAERIDRTPAQVLLRWAIQHQTIVIPKSSSQERIRSNAQVFDFELGDDDMRFLDALDRTNGGANARG